MKYFKVLLDGKKLIFACTDYASDALLYNIDGSDPEVAQIPWLDAPVEISHREYHRLLRMWFVASELKQLTTDIDTHNWVSIVPTYSRQLPFKYKGIGLTTTSGRLSYSDDDTILLSLLIDRLLSLPDYKINVITVPLNHRGHTLHSVKIMPVQNVVYWGCTDRETDEFISYSDVVPFDALETMLATLDDFKDLIK